MEITSINLDTERQFILNQIKEHADPEQQKSRRRLIPTKLKVYGVRTPQMRTIARNWFRNHKQISFETLLALINALWSGDSLEEKSVSFELFKCYEQWVPCLSEENIDKWRQDVDNWEIADGLGVCIVGIWLLQNVEHRQKYLMKLVAEENVWSRRIAVVSTVVLNDTRKNVSFPELTLQIIDLVKDDHRPMVTKAISWALREMIAQHPHRIAAYIKHNDNVLAKHVIREVKNKLQTGLKSGSGKKS